MLDQVVYIFVLCLDKNPFEHIVIPLTECLNGMLNVCTYMHAYSSYACEQMWEQHAASECCMLVLCLQSNRVENIGIFLYNFLGHFGH